MLDRRRRAALAITGVVAILTAGVAIAAGGDDPEVKGVRTTRPAQLVATTPGVRIQPILSVGDVIGGRLGGYQMTGIPDGLGAYRTSKSTVELFMNHELDGEAPQGVGARVSHLTLDTHRRVRAARYELDGTEGFLRFCSSTLAMLGGVPWYFTGEETTDAGAPPIGGRGGSSVALNGQTGRWYETRHFGLFAHENVVPVKQLKVAMMVSSEDGPAGLSQLYAYTAISFRAAIRGHGQLWVWKPNKKAGDGNPSSNDIAKGQTLQGRFVPLSQADNADADTLEAAAQAKGAFDFVRLEDVAVSKTQPGVVYFDDTGAEGQELVKGRLYKLRINPNNPTRASLTVLLDGDAGDDMVNPDNLDVSARGVMVIQEDRNAEHRGPEVAGGYGRVLVYDLASGSLRPVARVNTPASLAPGTWESSGVIDASRLLGEDWWLLDVQAHDQTAPQPGPDLEVNSSVGEDGQLLAIRIPNST